MSKIASVKLSWAKSKSPDVVKTTLSVAIDGQAATVTGLGPEVESVVIDVNAKSSVVFSVTVTDSEGLSVVSENYTFTLGDLEAPLPATNLFHEVVAILEEPTV